MLRAKAHTVLEIQRDGHPQKTPLCLQIRPRLPDCSPTRILLLADSPSAEHNRVPPAERSHQFSRAGLELWDHLRSTRRASVATVVHSARGEHPEKYKHAGRVFAPSVFRGCWQRAIKGTSTARHRRRLQDQTVLPCQDLRLVGGPSTSSRFCIRAAR